jgi:hypothetical protein
LKSETSLIGPQPFKTATSVAVFFWVSHIPLELAWQRGIGVVFQNYAL